MEIAILDKKTIEVRKPYDANIFEIVIRERIGEPMKIEETIYSMTLEQFEWFKINVNHYEN
jgi:hypothetical protein